MTEAKLPFKVKAIYEYKSDFEDDLPFTVDQVITVTEIEDEEWYSGTYDGKSGMFPKNFVEILPPDAPSIPVPARPISKKKDEEEPGKHGTRSVENDAESGHLNEPKPVEKDDTKTSAIGASKPAGGDVKLSPGKVPVPVFPTSKVNDPYTIKKQFIGSEKSSYVPKITPREDRTVRHIYEDNSNNTEIVKGTDVTHHEEEEGPKVSLKERIALLQKRQQEEAEREAAALKKQEERKKRQAEEKQKAKERRAEVSSIRSDDFEDASEVVHSHVDTNHTGESARSHQSIEQHSTGHSISIPHSVPEHEEPYEEAADEEDEAEEEEDEVEEDEDDEPESDDEELKRRKLVERMAKISGGRNMFGMMGMPSPFGAPATEKPKKISKRKTSESLDTNQVPGLQEQTPINSPTSPRAKHSHSGSVNLDDGQDIHKRESIASRESHGYNEDDTQESDPAALTHSSPGVHLTLPNLETGYEADEDSSDMARTITAVPPRVDDSHSVPEFEPTPSTPSAPSAPPVPSAVPVQSTPPAPSAFSAPSVPPIPQVPGAPPHLPPAPPIRQAAPVPSAPVPSAPPVPQVPVESPIETRGIELPNVPPPHASSHLENFDKLPPPPPPPVEADTRRLVAHDEDVAQKPKLPPPPPPPTTAGPAVPNAEFSGSSDESTDNEFAFVPSQASRAKTEVFQPPVPTAAPPNLERARTDISDSRILETSTGASYGSTHTQSHERSIDSGLSRARSIRSTEKTQAELSLEALEFEIGNISGSSNWWLKGELPEVLAERLGHDLIYEVDTNVIKKRGGRVINYRDYYVTFYDLSQIVFELEYETEDPRATIKFVNYFTKPIPIIRKDLLDRYHREFSHLILNSAGSLLGRQINDDIVLVVLHQLTLHENGPGSKMIGPIGDKSYGVTIYKNFNNANISKIDDVKPGDILWIKQGKFVSHKNLIGSKKIVGKENDANDNKAFCAIIYEYDNKKEKFKVLELDSTGHVIKESYKIGDFKSGKIRVFRTVGRDYIQWD